jgi:hypothetical protein
MIIRWISLVPSKMVKILASRCQCSTGYSLVAVAVEELDRLLGHPDRRLPATSWDIEPSARSKALPWRAIQAAPGEQAGRAR